MTGEGFKTLRTLIRWFFGTLCIAIIAYCVIHILDKPSWLELSLAVVAAIAGFGVPFLVVWSRIRVKELEVLRKMTKSESDDPEP